ncbi:MAG: PaaI family thioesterase [Firmicutes bacterium]|nr:PaaI family thioesterase [Bacillota bacterium]
MMINKEKNKIGEWPEMGWEFLEPDDGELITVFIPHETQIGVEGGMHTGLCAMVFDETMGRAVNNLLRRADLREESKFVTAEMTVNFNKPIPVETEMYSWARIEKEEGRCMFTSAEIIDKNGEVFATAKGRFVRIKSR